MQQTMSEIVGEYTPLRRAYGATQSPLGPTWFNVQVDESGAA